MFCLPRSLLKLLANNLALHQSSLIPLIRKGNPPDLTVLLQDKELMFWGDLDMAGLKIYSDLKLSFPQIRLSGLYYPMVDLLHQGMAHPYVKATGKEGQKPFNSNESASAFRDPSVPSVAPFFILVRDSG